MPTRGKLEPDRVGEVNWSILSWSLCREKQTIRVNCRKLTSELVLLSGATDGEAQGKTSWLGCGFRVPLMELKVEVGWGRDTGELEGN